MPETLIPDAFLDSCTVDPAVLALRPDYRALLMVVDDLPSGIEADRAEQRDTATTGQQVDDLVTEAERYCHALLADTPVESLPHIAAWREAYRAFGAKPQRTRNSLEALVRRAGKGLPRVNTLTDIYNAICILHQVPLGGEDLLLYKGPAALVRATGDEIFETTAHGEPATEHPEPGEVVWRDDAGVTCRRWNWRQCRRTGLTESTRTAFFILDALAPVSDGELDDAGQALEDALRQLSPQLTVTRRVVGSR